MKLLKRVGRGDLLSSRGATLNALPFGGLNGLYMWYDLMYLVGESVNDANQAQG